MRTKQQILTLLLQQPGSYVSGDWLSQHLNISRGSVWKAIQTLKAAGHEIISRKKAGYAYLYSRKVDALVLARSFSLLGLADANQPLVEVFDQIDSTQTYAKDYVAKHSIDRPAVFIGREQMNGYGRQGRSYYSPKNRGLYVSVALPLPGQADLQPSLLTTSAAVALVEGLQIFFPEEPFRLKWVNDLILHQRKIGGIITEGVFDLERQQYGALVLGFAINIDGHAFPPAIQKKAGSIFNVDQPGLDLNLILGQLLINLLAMAKNYQSGTYLKTYRQRSLLLDHRITVKVGLAEKTGLVTGISDQGGLLLLNDQTQVIETLYAGEVTKVKLLENLNL